MSAIDSKRLTSTEKNVEYFFVSWKKGKTRNERVIGDNTKLFQLLALTLSK